MSRSHNDTHELIDGPPPEVLSEIEAAWERAQELPEIQLEADHGRRCVFAGVVGRRITTRHAVLVGAATP